MIIGLRSSWEWELKYLLEINRRILFGHLGKVGLANQNYSINKNDGLKLLNTYLTLSKNVFLLEQTNKQELLNCSNYLNEEFLILKNVKVIVALGKIAFDSIIFYKYFHLILKE